MGVVPVSLQGDAEWKIVNLISPGSTIQYAKLEYSESGKTVRENIVFWEGSGLDFRQNPKSDYYTVSASKLVRIDKIDGKEEPCEISPEDYKHGSNFLPKKRHSCRIGNNTYRLSLEVDTPKRNPTNLSGPKPKTGTPNDSSKIDLDVYKEMASGLYGYFSGGTLFLNKNNERIVAMACVNRRDQPALFARWVALYKKASTVVRDAYVDLKEVLEVSFQKAKSNDDKFVGRYEGSAENYFLNSYLKCVFTGEESESLIEAIRKNKPTNSKSDDKNTGQPIGDLNFRSGENEIIGSFLEKRMSNG